MEKLKAKWGIQSNLQLVIVFVVFAVTGSSSVFVSNPLLQFLGISKDNMYPLIYYVLKVILIFPIYLILLNCFGLIAGQFRFFWNFSKRMLSHLGLGFLFP